MHCSDLEIDDMHVSFQDKNNSLKFCQNNIFHNAQHLQPYVQYSIKYKIRYSNITRNEHCGSCPIRR